MLAPRVMPPPLFTFEAKPTNSSAEPKPSTNAFHDDDIVREVLKHPEFYAGAFAAHALYHEREQEPQAPIHVFSLPVGPPCPIQIHFPFYFVGVKN